MLKCNVENAKCVGQKMHNQSLKTKSISGFIIA